MPSNPLGVPGVELHAAASPKDEDRPAPVWEERTQEQDSGPRQAQEPVAQTTALRFSEALALFEEDDIRNGGNADARALVLLVVQFIIDKMDDPLLVEFDKEAAARIDAMLPDIPDRKNIPREHTFSLAALRLRPEAWLGWTEASHRSKAEERLSQCPLPLLRLADRAEALPVRKTSVLPHQRGESGLDRERRLLLATSQAVCSGRPS